LRLGLEDDGAVDREIGLARVETLRAAVAAASACPGAETADLVRYRYELQLRRAEEDVTRAAGSANGASAAEPADIPLAEADGDEAGGDADAAVVHAATQAQRRRLVALRADGTIGDAAFQRVEEELDWAELDWGQFLRVGQRADAP